MKTRILSHTKAIVLFILYVAAIFLMTKLIYKASIGCHLPAQSHLLNLSGEYGDDSFSSFFQKIVYRIKAQPFNFISLVIFFLAILHTFFASKITQIAQDLRQKNIKSKKKVVDNFAVECLEFLGEVEVIFGLWVIPLLVAMTLTYNWATAVNYLSSRDFTEPLFVVVIMTVASSKPILKLAENCLKFVSKMGGGTVTVSWLTILTLGPLAGSLITEPGAMTISALLLANQFYTLKPSTKFSYATLGLLFVNISVGGVLTSFAAPPVLMVCKVWAWDTTFMFSNFGTKAALGIVFANLLYFFLFRKELALLETKRKKRQNEIKEKEHIPFWITLTHLSILAWMVVHSHFPVLFIGSFLFFLGFHKATSTYQNKLLLKTPILVGFFLAGLVIHGSLQAWWITPLLSNIGSGTLMVLATILTAFNDNAEVTFLASLIPSFTDAMKYAVVAGAVTGGGLTVIANAPNPLGQAILGKYFAKGIQPLYLFFAALLPTLIVGLLFWIF